MKTIVFMAVLAITGCTSVQKLVDPSALTIEVDSSWQAGGKFTHWELHGDHYEAHAGTLGRIAVVMDAPVKKGVNLRYGIEHRSLIRVDDRGEERIVLGVTWKPFAH